MASFVFSLFFLVSLISSITAANPTGLKIRIAEGAQDVLIRYGIQFLQGLVNQPTLPKFSKAAITIKPTLTKLEVDPAQVKLDFKKDFGLEFEINNLHLRVKLEREVNVVFFKKYRSIWDLPLVTSFIKVVFCPGVKMFAVPKINDMLGNLVKTKINTKLEAKLVEKSDKTVDYSLSDKGIAVTDHHLEMSFRGLILKQDASKIPEGVAPVLMETDQMVCVGVSEYLFNSAALTLFNLGPLQFDYLEINSVIQRGTSWITGLNFSKDKGKVIVKFNDVPTITMKKGEGLFANLNIKLTQGTEIHDVAHEVALMVEFEGGQLIPKIKNLKCEDTSVNFLQRWAGTLLINYLLRPAVNFWYRKGIPMPLPEGLGIRTGKIEYHDGYMVAGGDLYLM